MNEAKSAGKYPKYGIPNFAGTIILKREALKYQTILVPTYDKSNNLIYALLANSDVENYNYQYLKIEPVPSKDIMDDFVGFDYDFAREAMRTDLKGLLDIDQPTSDNCWKKRRYLLLLL